MKIDWSPLRTCLARYRQAGVTLPIWWRDDDAVSATPALERLADLSQAAGMDVLLAVIPDLADQSLAEFIEDNTNLIPVTHGWRHDNNAPADKKKSEFGTDRGAAASEIRAGVSVMKQRFGARFRPLFVPPWNRIDPVFLPALVEAGYTAVSTFAPRKAAFPVPGLEQVNTHIDPIDWHGTRDLHNPDRLISHLVKHLEDRRQGQADASEPLGYLTHHLVHSDKVWEFSHQLLNELLHGGAAPGTVIAPPETTR